MRKFLMLALAPLFVLAFVAPVLAAGAAGPDVQSKFIQLVEDYKARYAAESNPLKKTSLSKERLRKLMDVTPGGMVSGWTGVISGMDTTGAGKAYVSIAVPRSPVTFQTWNNDISDAGNNTLIPSSSPLYQALADMAKGMAVVFSGKLVKEASMTESGGMEEPEFIIRFTSIKPASAR